MGLMSNGSYAWARNKSNQKSEGDEEIVKAQIIIRESHIGGG